MNWAAIGNWLIDALAFIGEFVMQQSWKLIKNIGWFFIKTPKNALLSCIAGGVGMVVMFPSLLTPDLQRLLIATGIMAGLGWICYLHIKKKYNQTKKLLGLGGKKKK